MLASKLFQFLGNAEVQEIMLQSGRPPCALMQDVYRKLSNQNLRDEDIIGVLAAAKGQEHLANLADGRRWKFKLPEHGSVLVSAGYDNGVLQATLRLAAKAKGELQPDTLELDAPQPTAAASPRRRTSTRPPRASSRPPRKKAKHDDEPKKDSLLPEPTLPSELTARMAAAANDIYALPLPEGPSDMLELEDPGQAWARTQAAAARVGRALSQPGADNTRGDSTRALSQPLGEAKVITAHDAFNFEAGNWAPSIPLIEEVKPAAPALKIEARPRAAATGVTGAAADDLLDALLGQARELKASDVHIVAGRPALFRIAAELAAVGEIIDEQTAERLLLPRVPESLRAMLEQHGSADFSLVHPVHGRFRANVSRQRTGLKLTARPIGDSVPTLEELGLPESISRAVHHHQGLIVVTGPTGHGKTTTLAAIVGIINRETSHHVITVEDPIEYIHEQRRAIISQREVGSHTKSFANALKGSLREDPDVIVVGELRDTETVRMALTASETGHLVISTMNTPSAAKAIERLIDLFPPGDQPQVRMTLAGGLRLIVSQRLLPTADRKGLCAAAEVLPGMLPLWNLIRENRTYQIPSLQQRGKSLGIVRLDESLAQLVRSGKTTLELAKEVAEAPEHFAGLVAGRPAPVVPVDAADGGGAARAGAAAANAAASAANAGAQAAKKGADLGKQVLSRAGKLFGGG